MADEKRNASNIIKHDLLKCPNLNSFLRISLKDIEIDTKKVGMKFSYPPSVTEKKSYGLHGNFMDYFIRKHLANQFGIELHDQVAEFVLKNQLSCIKNNEENRFLINEIEKNYKIFKDPNTKAINIVNSIKKVSLSKHLRYNDPFSPDGAEVNTENLLEIIKYFTALPFSSVEIKPDIGNEWIEGHADWIFDKSVMYELKTSKYEKLSKHGNIKVRTFYKLMLYAYGYYKKTKVIIKDFIIYNALLGQEHRIKIGDIDMEHFEQVLKKDVENLR